MATLSLADFKEIKGEKEDLKKTRMIGFELEFAVETTDDENSLFREIRNDKSLFAGIGHDGGGVELMTHPITITKFFDEQDYLKKCLEYIRTKHPKVVTTAGLHINISKLPTDNKHTYQHLLWLYIMFNEQIQKILGRVSHWARSPFEMLNTNKMKIPTTIAKEMMNISIGELKQEDIEAISACNNKAYAVVDKSNRYEFRGSKCSIDFHEIMGLAQFCYNMLELAAKPTLKGVCFANLLQGEYINNYFFGVVQVNENRKLTETEIHRTLSKVKYVSLKEKQGQVY